MTLLTLIDSPQTLVYHCSSHFQCYCGGITATKNLFSLHISPKLFMYEWLANIPTHLPTGHLANSKN